MIVLARVSGLLELNKRVSNYGDENGRELAKERTARTVAQCTPQTMKLDLRAQVGVTIRGMFRRGNAVVSHPEQGHSR